MSASVQSATALDRAVPSARDSRRAATAGAVGTFIEWYDQALYGTASALVIAPLFFPTSDGFVGLLASFATFALGFVARPIGGIVLGALGDKYGRRPVLLFCVVLVGAVTGAIGFLPTFQQIGIAAPIILVLLRLVQGFGSGAELAGAITYMNENVTPGRKGFFISFAAANVAFSSFVATGLFAMFSLTLPSEQFLSWGWRIPFIFSLVLTGIAFAVRASAKESVEYTRVKSTTRLSAIRSLVLAFKASPRNFFATFLLPSSMQVGAWTVTAFGLSYVIVNLGMSRSVSLLATLITAIVSMVAVVFLGRLVDRIGPKRVVLITAGAAAVFAFPYFLLLQTRIPALVIVASVILYVLAWGGTSAAQGVFLPSLFKTEYRYSGIAFPRELNGALIGGPVPLVATVLVAVLNGQPWLVAVMLIVAMLFAIAGVIIGKPMVDGQGDTIETPAATAQEAA